MNRKTYIKTLNMKIIDVPYVSGAENPDSFDELNALMEAKAAKASIDTVCWPDEFPYAPEAGFAIARTDTRLVILYSVKGLDLRAQALEDNGPVWEDSCCEFFVADPCDGTYYNFEMNCIGTLLAAKRKSRSDCTHFGKETLERIKRFSTLEKKAFDESGREFSWKTALCIPFDIIGMEKDRLPKTLKANFYKCGDKTAHPHFLSWNPVETEHPDFHRPEFFGELKLR